MLCMDTLLHQIKGLRTSRLFRSVALPALTGIAAGQCYAWVNNFIPHYEGPWWMRLGFLLLPWLVFGLFGLCLRGVRLEDELEQLITRRALGFAFYGMLVVVLVVEQLQCAVLIPRFAWSNGVLLLAMIVLLLAGIGWSKLRYR